MMTAYPGNMTGVLAVCISQVSGGVAIVVEQYRNDD